jgi:hypothetical protein
MFVLNHFQKRTCRAHTFDLIVSINDQCGILIAAMNALTKSAICMLLVSVLWAGAQSSSPLSPSAGPSVSEIAGSFTNYQLITRGVVLVNPEISMRCAGASKTEVDAARNKSGPHANTGILIYMNKLAAEAFNTNASVFPVGAVVVKQKWMLGGDHDANTGVGGMIKRSAGYDPEHGDWEYFYFEDAKKIESGRISSCVQCNESAKSKDYVFGTWKKTGD